MAILKVFRQPEWSAFLQSGETAGAPVDVEDGFIHFSTPAQVRETVARHFAGESGLMLAEVDEKMVADDLRWEPSRGGDLFPHLYRPLRLADIARALPWEEWIAEERH